MVLENKKGETTAKTKGLERGEKDEEEEQEEQEEDKKEEEARETRVELVR